MMSRTPHGPRGVTVGAARHVRVLCAKHPFLHFTSANRLLNEKQQFTVIPDVAINAIYFGNLYFPE
jgi:hypothetical protein